MQDTALSLFHENLSRSLLPVRLTKRKKICFCDLPSRQRSNIISPRSASNVAMRG